MVTIKRNHRNNKTSAWLLLPTMYLLSLASGTVPLFTSTSLASNVQQEEQEEPPDINKNDIDLRAKLHRILQQQPADNNTTTLSNLATTAFHHLIELTTDPETGRPNPRIACTVGNGRAAMYIANEMERIGLIPLGDINRTSYFQTIPFSINDEYCPSGFQNIIGMVQGTQFPDEYVMYNAHYDGPNNNNPQTETTRGNFNVTNVFDDGLAVALGLAMAEEFIRNDPPPYSVIFFFDDGEEGWFNLGARKIRENPVEPCLGFNDTEWFRNVSDVISREETCGDFLIGSRYWVQNPTVNVSAIRMNYVIDAIGPAYNADLSTAAIGGEFGAFRGGNLNNFLDTVWPAEYESFLFKMQRIGIGLGTSADAFSTIYKFICGDSCVPAGGIPTIWFAQPSFQKYHSGSLIEIAKFVFDDFLPDGEFFTTAYFSVDNLDALDLVTYNDTVSMMFEMLRNTAFSTDLDAVQFVEFNGTYVEEDLMNIIATLDRASELLTRIVPEDQQITFSFAIAQLRQQAQTALGQTPINPLEFEFLSFSTVSFLIILDFFNVNYPNQEAYLDQSFGGEANIVEPEPLSLFTRFWFVLLDFILVLVSIARDTVVGTG